MPKKRSKGNDNRTIKKRKVTPTMVPKKRTMPDPPKKKRVRKKGEVQTLLAKEKAIITSFPRKFTPRSSELVGQRLGRSGEWVKTQQKNLVLKEKNPLMKEIPLFSTLMKVKGKNGVLLKNVMKGCDLYCEGTGELVTCPSCKKFQFHMDCLQKILHSLGKPGVDPETSWKCAHC